MNRTYSTQDIEKLWPERYTERPLRRLSIASKQCAELIRRHADNDQDASQSALGHVATRMNWDRNRAPVGMSHHVVAASDPLDNEPGAFERLDYLGSRYRRDAARHKAGSYQNSGDVECQSQLVWWPDHIKQSFKCGAQVGDRLFLRCAITHRADARPDLGRGAPDAILVLLDDVGHVNDTSHALIIARGVTTVTLPLLNRGINYLISAEDV